MPHAQTLLVLPPADLVFEEDRRVRWVRDDTLRASDPPPMSPPTRVQPLDHWPLPRQLPDSVPRRGTVKAAPKRCRALQFFANRFPRGFALGRGKPRSRLASHRNLV